MSDRKLRAWLDAGLIDAAQAQRIRAWEAEHDRPLALWAVMGLAALAIGLGIVSVVAANWDLIPAQVRLAVHLALVAAMLIWLWLARSGTAAKPWLVEAQLFVTGVLGLTFMAHLGQVYQTSAPLWQPLTLWLVLFAPVLLLRGQGWLAAALLFGIGLIAAWNFAEPITTFLGVARPGALISTVVTALPAVVVLIAAWGRTHSPRQAFWLTLEYLAVGYVLGAVSVLVLGSGNEALSTDGTHVLSFGMLALRALLLCGLAFALARIRPGTSGRATAGVLLGCAAVLILVFPLSGSPVAAALLFMVLWAGVGLVSLIAGWRHLFQLAVAMVALRLIALSFELEHDLLTSGAGLILSGVMTMAIALSAVRIARRYAPEQQG